MEKIYEFTIYVCLQSSLMKKDKKFKGFRVEKTNLSVLSKILTTKTSLFTAVIEKKQGIFCFILAM